MFITKNYYAKLENTPVKIARSRFTRYYNDLFLMEGVGLPSFSSYNKKNAYSFVDIGDEVLSLCDVENSFLDFDLFLVAYWSHEYDPDHTFGAYFCERYGIAKRTFDVCDQGVLAPLTALYLMQLYMTHGKVEKGALLCMDQAAIPVEHKFKGVLPSFASARVLLLSSKRCKNACYQITSLNFKKGEIKESLPYHDQIFINKEDARYNCAELFHSLFEVSHSIKKKNIRIIVSDSESSNSASMDVRSLY